MSEYIEAGDGAVKAEIIAPPSYQPSTRPWKDFAGLINTTWRKGVTAFIDTGRYLLEAKAELDRDIFESLVKRHLDFDSSVGRKLMAVAGNHLICAHGHKLPPCWTTIYELSKLDDEVLKAGFADGTIHPGMERKDASALRLPKPAEQGQNDDQAELTVPVASARGSAEPAVIPPDPSPDNLGQLIEAIDRVYQLGHADSVLISAALTQQAKKKIQKCLRELAGTLRTLRNEITKSTNITKADATHLIGCKLTCSADVDTALKDWRRRPSHELPDLALAVRRTAGHGLHLSEKQWRTIREIEAKAVIAGMQAA